MLSRIGVEWPERPRMSEFVRPREVELPRGTLRWLAVTVGRAWRGQALAALGTVALAWPALLLAFLLPGALLAWVIAVAAISISGSATAREFTVDAEAFLEAAQPDRRRGRERGGSLWLYVMMLSGLTFFVGLTVVMSVGAALATSVFAPSLAPYALVVTPPAMVGFERWQGRVFGTSMTLKGVSMAEGLRERQKAVTINDKLRRSSEADVAKVGLRLFFAAPDGQPP